MAAEKLSIDEVRALAAEIGMTRLNEAHLRDLLRATEAARARRQSLDTRGLTYADEPSHVFSLTGDAK